MREALKEICRRIIFPPTAIVLGGVPITAALMSYVFGFGHDDDPVAYVAYLVSAYSFAVLCIWASCRAKPLVRALREWLQRIPLANRFLSDHAFRWMATQRFSTLANIFYAAMKLWMGIAYQSLWFITFAVYYMLLRECGYCLYGVSRRSGWALIGGLRIAGTVSAVDFAFLEYGAVRHGTVGYS